MKNVQPYSVKTQKITPEMAKTMLDSNSGNRRLNPAIVARYAALMKSGQWMQNGNTFKIDWFGELKDGQHRLAAAIEADFTFDRAIVVHGLDPDVFDTIDTGKNRTATDALFAGGFQANPKLVAAVANLAIKEEQGTTRVNRYIEPHRVREWVIAHPRVHNAVERVKDLSFLGFTPVLGYVWLLVDAQDEAKAKRFFEQLETGEGLQKGDPALTLRDTLLKHKADRTYRKAEVLQMCMSAWQSFVKEKSLPTLRRNMKAQDFFVV